MSLKELGFTPSKAEPQIFIRKSSTREVYELVGVYLDNLAIIMGQPSRIPNSTSVRSVQFYAKGVRADKFPSGMWFCKR